MKWFALPVAVALTALAPMAMAQQAGTYTLGFGLGSVNPKDDNGTLAGVYGTHVAKNVQPTFTFEYFIRDNLGIEVLAATPFRHKVDLNGTKAAEVTHLPPTVSLQYHFANSSNYTPFVGVGVNYTAVLDVKEKGPLVGTDLDLDNSWGVALHAGLDYKVTDRSAVRVDVRWMDIDLDAKLNGQKIGTVKVDPWIFGASYVISF